MKGRKPDLRVVSDARSENTPPPPWLPKEAKAEWRRVMPGLLRRRILTDEDMACLENYCLQIGEARVLTQKIQKLTDWLVYSREGTPRPHPYFRARRDAMTVARQLAVELGLTPVSRSRPALNQQGDDEDEWSGLVDG